MTDEIKKEKTVQRTQKKKPTISMTPEESAIFSRVTAEDNGWKETITEEGMNDFSLSEDPYKLPAPAQKKENREEFKFRWIEKDSKRVDFVRNLDVPKRWWVCNSTNSPYLKGFFDPLHGAVQKLDQILVFKPWSHHIAKRRLVDQLSSTQRDSGKIKQTPSRYQDGEAEWHEGADNKINPSRDIVHNEDMTNDLGDLLAEPEQSSAAI